MQFLDHVTINSKEKGEIVLGEHVYSAQTRLLNEIFAGLAEDIHDFKVLKSRQLGVSTLSRALTLFWAGVHSGLRGYMVLDTTPHAEEARGELLQMVEGLPRRLGFPTIKRQNRYQLVLSNNTVINFASAGVKRSGATGTMGRGSGVNFVHASEISSWADPEQYEAFRNALAQDYPDRFYLWETTARGFNLWNTIWENAKEDVHHQRTIFLGWWSKDNQIIREGSPDFERYATSLPTPKEKRRIEAVKRLYGHEVTREQLAWFRRQMDPRINSLSSDASSLEEDPLRLQEQPWTEDEAFQQSGSTFFDPEKLAVQQNEYVCPPKNVWSYDVGLEFIECRIYPAHNVRSIQLRVWEEPVPSAVYVLAADPAFGASEKNDRSAIQICRCYADGLDQVAEYAWPLVNTKQFAWIIASLLGWYGEQASSVYFILELNGPGSAVWAELESLKRNLTSGYMRDHAADAGVQRIFQNVRNYFYNRSDSVFRGMNTYHWKTQRNVKVQIMERLRDFTVTEMFRARSRDLVDEMRSIAREGDSIEASGSNKDDRVIAAALAVRCWEDKARPALSQRRRTREAEMAEHHMTFQDQVRLMNETQLSAFFGRKARARHMAERAMKEAMWRMGRR